METPETTAASAKTEKYGSVYAWSVDLGVSSGVLYQRLEDAPSVQGRARTGVTLFYAESVVRATCADLLQPFPQADGDGFIVANGPSGEPERFSTAWNWEIQKKLPIRKRIQGSGAVTIQARVSGQVFAFYPESVVEGIISDARFDEIPQVADDGFFSHCGERYASIKAWGTALGVGEKTVRDNIEHLTGMEGRSKIGVVNNGYYAESAVREALGHRLDDVPQANVDGYILIQNAEGAKRYASNKHWARILDLHFNTLKKRLKDKPSIDGKDSLGRVRKASFYEESIVREACADLLQELPKAGEDLFLVHESIRYATSNALGALVGINEVTLKKRLKEKFGEGVTGKDAWNHVLKGAFYTVEQARAVLDSPLADGNA